MHKPMTPAQREKAREAVRRSRARRKEQREAKRPQACAIERINTALREMIFGKVSHSRYYRGEVRTWDRTDDLASALFDALGSDHTAKLFRKLAHEVEIGGTSAQREREFRERYGGRNPLDVVRDSINAA